MPLTENNKKAVNNHIINWMDELGKAAQDGGGLAATFTKCNELTDYVMDLCQKAYDKGIEETVNKKD